MIVNKKKVECDEKGIHVDRLDDNYKGQHHLKPRQISFYDSAPKDVIGIYEFQNIAVSRLQVLKKIQFLYDSNKDGSDSLMADEINKYSRTHSLNIEGLYDKSKNSFNKIA